MERWRVSDAAMVAVEGQRCSEMVGGGSLAVAMEAQALAVQ